MTNVSNERRTATASYIEGMLIELRTMGQQVNADFLVYLLEMAIIEADDIKRGQMTAGRKRNTVDGSIQSITAQEMAELFMAENA